MFSYSKKHKRLRHFFAYVLSLAMVLSNLSYMQVQASTVSGGDAQIMQVSEDGVASVSNNNSGVGDSSVYALDITLAGNNVTDTTKWSESGGWYKLDSNLSTDKVVQSNGVFGYWPTGSKVKMKDGLGGIQLDGSVNAGGNGQAAIEMDLTNMLEGEYTMEIVYTSKNANESVLKLGDATGLSEVDSSSANSDTESTYTTTLASGAAYQIGATNGIIVKSLILTKVVKVVAANDYELDVTLAGNNVTDTTKWSESGGWYKLDSSLSSEKIVQSNGVFGYWPTGSKVKMKDGLGGIQLDGSANKSGQATIEIDLTNVPEGTYAMELTYVSKSEGTASIVNFGDYSGLSTKDSSNTSKTTSEVYTTTLESGSVYLVGGKNGMVVQSLKVSKLEDVTISGTVSCATGTTFPTTCALTFNELDAAGNEIEGKSYNAAINTADGSYSITLPGSTFGIDYSVTFSDAEYIFSPSVEKVTVVKGSTEAVDLTVLKAAVYTLSGSYKEGLGEDWVNLTKLEFTPVTESAYAELNVTLDTAAGTYSVMLEKGTTYAISAEGVNGYELTVDEITYEADTVHNIVFRAKPTYPIAISLGSTPNLTGKSLVYTFTHSDGSVYSFTDASAIQLRDGNYKVALGGDMAQMAYGINVGDTLTVSGAPVNHVITFRPLTSWSFGTDYTDKIEGTTGWYKGLSVDATSGKLAPHASSGTAQFNAGTKITVPVSGPCKIAVSAYQAQYATYTINGEAASTDTVTTEVEYTGAAGTIDIVSTGSAYIASITLTYPAKEVEYVEQSVMPFVPASDTDGNTEADTDNIPRRNNEDSITVQPVGQKLNLSQTGGSFADKFADTDNVAYYLFPMTDKHNKLEFDLVVTESKSTGNAAGFFGGVFTDNYVYSLGLRAGGQKIRGIYSKNGGLEGGSFAGAGSPNEEVVGLNRTIHYTIEWDTTAKRHKVSINFLDDAGVLQERSWSQNPIPEPDGSTPTEFYYGVALADVSVVITNMLYTGEDGSVLYDQNACYYPNGSAPTATSVSAVAAEARTHIDVTWTGSVAEDDGTYVVEMQKDGGEWVELNDDVTGFSYRYEIPAGDGGEYLFRVCGQLGKETLGGDRTAYATMAEAIYVVGALETPVIEITGIERVDGETGTLTLNWQQIASAEYYQLYRYSDDQGEAGAECIAERLTTNSYVDTVEIDMPYYYYVKAVSEAADNESPYSEIVWSMVPSSRTAHRVQYGAETEDIFLTKKSYDTVFTDKATVEGIVYADGTLEVWVNDVVVEEKQVTEGASFAYELTLEEGRNDVELRLVKDAETTRRALNFVYLTKYDIVVDGAYDGTDGAANANGIPTYKTVQAAVNSVPSDNADSKVILVMAGSYEERLEVSTPFISLIGEDRENTLIHFYPGELGSNYEAGGDMDKRCATYIKSGAKNFSAENISFANDYVYGTKDGKSNKSADAIRVEAENSTFVNVHFIGVQDTLYMHSGYQYYEKCLIEGLVDFIYSGEAARSVFKDCELRFVYESTKTSGYVSAPKTAADAEYGLVFVDCSVTAEEGCAGNGYLLARPWGADAYIAWVNTYMGKAVNELAPYGDMNGNMHEDARFFEFGTYGPGFAINADRRQMSFTKANNFIKKSWVGIENMNDLSSEHYIGDIVTDAEEKFEETEPNDDKYLWSEGDDTGLGMYGQEGYASYYEVTGGGLLKETNDNYYLVSTAEDFLDALVAIKASGKPSVIELIADIKLGCNEIANFDDYSGIIKAYNAQPLTHPTLIESGVSQVTFDKINNLTIFSQYGSTIKHANITMKNSENIIIRNIKFDELWEWDEATGGDYDRNDWDYMTVDSTCDGIWVDHCTFYKAYDGIIDVKNPAPTVNVTISWCEFLPGSEYNVFFNAMMDEIFENPSEYPTYQHMLEEGMTNEQIYMYAYGQKKTHLFGQSDDAVSAAGIRATLANNYYKDTMDRLPRLRYGYSHVYNCIMDAQNLLDVRLSISNEDIAKKIVSNGASSTCGAKVLLENCYISGIQNAMNSGNGSSPSGYINAINSLYYMDGVATELAPKVNTSKEGEPLLVTDADTFIADLPYEEYKLYDAEELHGIVIPYAGAGKLDLTVLQWEKTSYNVTEEEEVEEPEVEEAPINKAETGEKNSLPESVVNALKESTGCDTVEELIDYLRTEITTNEAVTENLSGINVADTVVVDIRVLVSYDGIQWDLATPANFPAEGVDVLIPYENIGSGTVELNKEGFDYVVGHMITGGNRIGQMEFFSGDDLIKTDEGIQIHIMSASPFVIGWKAVGSAEPTPGPTVAPGVEPTPGPTAEPQQTAAPGATQKPDFTPVLPSQITSPKTGDDSVWVYEELLPEKLPEKSDTINVPVMVGVDAVNNVASGESALWLMVLVIMGVFGIGMGIMSKRYLKKEEE